MNTPRSALLSLLLVACGSPGSQIVHTEVQHGQPGYQLAIQSAACWFGGLWSDAEGFPPRERREVTEQRCKEVTRLVYGDETRAQALHKIEPQEVAQVAQKASAQAGADKDRVAMLVQLVGNAEREALLARRVSHQLKRERQRDLGEHDLGEADRLTQEEGGLVETLRSYSGLEALLQADLGPLSGDAHTLGILVAIDRMETVRGLPKHLKLFAMEGTGRLVFNVPPPADMAATATEQIKPGVWLTQLQEIAKAAGYPVPDGVSKAVDRHMLAWNGILKGLADRLRTEEPRLSPEAAVTLRRIVEAVAKHLDDDYRYARRVAKQS